MAAAIDAWVVNGITYDSKQTDVDSLLPLHALTLERFVMDVASTLLQVATPETLLQHQPSLPPALLRSYLEEQEHFDLARVVFNTDSSTIAFDGGEAHRDDLLEIASYT